MAGNEHDIRGPRQERGFAILLGTFLALLLFSILALAVDVGLLYFIRTGMQAASDAGALSAALEVKAGRTNEIHNAAYEAASQNGFTQGQGGLNIVVNRPPATGPKAGNTSFVEVIMHKDHPTLFLRSLNKTLARLETRSVAGPGPNPNCLFVLDPSASKALELSGSAVVQANCGVQVNSNNSQAIRLSGSSCLNAAETNVVGQVSSSSSCGVNPAANTGRPALPDPLATLPAPAIGACTQTNFKVSGGTHTINPGVYCNGIDISSATVNFNPGTYILVGGGLNSSGGSSRLNGAGVFFYNTKNASYAYKPLVISGGGIATLSAPTSGSYAGILFYQDRTVVSSSDNTLSGGSQGKFEGTLYFPSTPLVYSGGSASDTNYTTIVAWRVQFSGSSRLDNVTSTLIDGSPVRSIGLAE